jgi:hypothetical protein
LGEFSPLGVNFFFLWGEFFERHVPTDVAQILSKEKLCLHFDKKLVGLRTHKHCHVVNIIIFIMKTMPRG